MAHLVTEFIGRKSKSLVDFNHPSPAKSMSKHIQGSANYLVFYNRKIKGKDCKKNWQFCTLKKRDSFDQIMQSIYDAEHTEMFVF